MLRAQRASGAHQELRRRRADDIVDLLDLIEFVRTRKEREEGDNLEKDAADAPHVHLVVVVAVGEQALGCSVPEVWFEQAERRQLVAKEWAGA